MSIVSQDQELREVVHAVLLSPDQASSERSHSQNSSDLSLSAELGTKGLELWERKRATLLLRIFATLDATQKTCLGGILSHKAKASKNTYTD
jgi:hypothetical protein